MWFEEIFQESDQSGRLLFSDTADLLDQCSFNPSNPAS
ncbi:hypothetical protein STRDD11_01487 [Streptococcus sp. DD11]|nr:hypothetical protein STRDD11_01487 [Streptococcus sp. DD11]